MADWAYDTDEIIKYINTNNNNLIIYTKSKRKIKRKIDKYIYKERDLVECLFQKLKWLRRSLLSFEKLHSSFFAFLYLVLMPSNLTINFLAVQKQVDKKWDQRTKM